MADLEQENENAESTALKQLKHVGTVAIIGVPNVGKSTLLNNIMGMKLSITCKKPQTTRNQVRGILERPGAQVVFIDTPGIHASDKKLNRYMVQNAVMAMEEADLVLVLSDFLPKSAELPPDCDLGIKPLLSHLAKLSSPVILALNKVDRLEDKRLLLPVMNALAKRFNFKDIYPISALKSDGVEALLEGIIANLPAGYPLFAAGTYTDITERFLAAEIIREKLMSHTQQEVPYSSAVTIDSFEDKREQEKPLVHIAASIIVERDSQKAIVIGKGGSMIRAIGTAARRELEEMLESRVYLDLMVKVAEKWTQDSSMLARLGYFSPEVP